MPTPIYLLVNDRDDGEDLGAPQVNLLGNTLEMVGLFLADLIGEGAFQATEFNGTIVPASMSLQISGGRAVIGDTNENRKIVDEDLLTLINGQNGITIVGSGPGTTNYFFKKRDRTTEATPETGWSVNTTGTPPANSELMLSAVFSTTQATSVDNLPATRKNIGFLVTTGKGALDPNGNEILLFNYVANAVNEITLLNAATLTPPQIQATGNNTDIDLRLVPKGVGAVQFGTAAAIGVNGRSVWGSTTLSTQYWLTVSGAMPTLVSNASPAGLNVSPTYLSTSTNTPRGINIGGTLGANTTSWVGLDITGPTVGGFTLGTAHGIRINAITQGTTNYALLSSGGDWRMDAGRFRYGAAPGTANWIDFTGTVPSSISGTSVIGIAFGPTFATTATSAQAAGWFRVATAAAGGATTVTNSRTLQVATPVPGANWTHTNHYGAFIQNQGHAQVGTAYGLYLDAQTGAATANYSIYSNGGDCIFNSGRVSLGHTTLHASLDVAGSRSLAAWGTSGAALNMRAATFTDNTTAASGTVASAVAYMLGIPTFAASNAMTITDAATLQIAAAPIASGTGPVTITRGWALLVDNGNVRVDDNMSIGLGAAAIDANAYLHIGGTAKCLLLPALTTTTRNNLTGPTGGLVIYNSTTGNLNYYDAVAGAWKAITAAAGA